MRWLVVLFASGCYHPVSVTPCTATCDFEMLGSAAPCPDGLACVEGGRCADPGAACGPGGEIDAMPDAPPCAGTLVGKDLLQICIAPNPTNRNLSGMVQTDDSSCNAAVLNADPALCVMAGLDVIIDGDLTGRGNRPLVIAATQKIRVMPSMVVDVASRSTMPGAAGSWIGCDASQTNGTSDGGGAGGSFQGQGGRGGFAQVVMNGGTPEAAHPLGVHGGCPGGGSDGATAGAGGGAIYFAAMAIVLDGDVIAFGGGGGGGAPGKGGGGGGAGGFIGLDAAQIIVGDGVGIVASGGGGGGGGGAASGAEQGGAGFEAIATALWIGLGGSAGTGQATGGMGGDGSLMTASSGFAGSPGGTFGTDTGGGGGGGGSAGFIKVRAGVTPTIGSQTKVTPSFTQ